MNWKKRREGDVNRIAALWPKQWLLIHTKWNKWIWIECIHLPTTRLLFIYENYAASLPNRDTNKKLYTRTPLATRPNQKKVKKKPTTANTKQKQKFMFRKSECDLGSQQYNFVVVIRTKHSSGQHDEMRESNFCLIFFLVQLFVVVVVVSCLSFIQRINKVTATTPTIFNMRLQALTLFYA